MTTKELNVSQLFWEQVALNFIVLAVLIACGALLTFKVMGEEYSEWTVVGFFATVFFAFIVFLPAGTLFAARAEFAKDKVEIRDDEKTGAIAPIANPLLETAPLGVAFAAVGTAIAYMLVYWGGWMPSPVVTTLVSLVFVVPYAIIVRQNIFREEDDKREKHRREEADDGPLAVFLAHDLEGQQRAHRDQYGDDDKVQTHLFPEQLVDA